MMKNGWENFGDVNPIEHGGIFVKPDTEEFPRCYYIVELINMSSAAGEPGFLISNGYVDLNNSEWVEWDRVLSFMGIYDEEVRDIDRVLGAFAYYGCAEFQGQEYLVSTEEEAIESLKKYHRIFLED